MTETDRATILHAAEMLEAEAGAMATYGMSAMAAYDDLLATARALRAILDHEAACS